MDETASLSDLWSSAIRSLDATALSRPHRAFLPLSRLVNVYGSVAVLAAPNEFAKDVLESRLRPPIEGALAALLGHEISLAVTVDPNLDVDEVVADVWADSTYAPGGRERPGSAPPARGLPAPRAADPTEQTVRTSRLNPRYVFDTFVAGASNRFAHAAAVAVAEMPARSYNPLVIYGESGLGKTHLLHAIGHYTQILYAGTKVRYVSSEEFTNEFINSIRDDSAVQFQRRYRDVDVLLVDDIQFLSGKVQTQEEFFHTFNTLHNANKQIVITSDIAPTKLKDFEDRMRTRFGWGLTTDIQPPDLETRIAILRRKTDLEATAVPPDVLEYIASRITRNIRELEGALIRVTAFASLSSRTIDLSLTEEVLRNFISNDAGPEITAPMIMLETSKFYSVSMDDLTGQSRSRTLVTARQVAMYLCRELTDLSLPKIGELFGGRDHTTVMHADRKIRQLMAERRSLYNSVMDLTARIRSAASSR
ncbi:MAG: chromosomal replication initiator protein DnaA [Candidatus Nanopelagicales bacterium]